MSELYMGIESGDNNETSSVLANGEGKVFAEGQIQKRLNYHELNKDELGSNLFALIRRTLDSAGIHVREFAELGGKLCVGLTGITTDYDRKIGMNEVWRSIGLDKMSPINTGSLEAAFAGATQVPFGAALSCGHGSAAFARSAAGSFRTGGWGYLLGDEGSYYWIGLRAIRSVCQHHDGRVQGSSVLNDLVGDLVTHDLAWTVALRGHEHQNVPWLDGLIYMAQKERATGEFRYQISKLADMLFQSWISGQSDQVIDDILEDASTELNKQIVSVLKRARFPDERIPVLLKGRVFIEHPRFRRNIVDRLHESFPNAIHITSDDERVLEPKYGALLIALSGSAAEMPPTNVIQNVREYAKYRI